MTGSGELALKRVFLGSKNDGDFVAAFGTLPVEV
jgi:hypothetical protein